MIARLTVWLLALPLCYVLPGARVLDQLETARKKQPIVHVVAVLATGAQGAPARVEADLHPEFGTRFTDGSGGRWVLRNGRAAASNRPELPIWIPQLEPLVLRARIQFEAWLAGVGIEPERNDLGRCGDEDCFVLGGRDEPEQLWIEKDRFEVRRLAISSGRNYSYDEYRDFEAGRFPGKIAVSDRDEVVATWTVQSVYEVPRLGADDFSERWATR